MSNSTKTNRSMIGRVRDYLHETQFAKRYGVMLFLLLLIAVSACFTPNFLSADTVKNTLRQSFPVVLAALGMTFVISSGGIDISVGATMALAAAVTAVLCEMGTPAAIAIGCGIVAAALCGAFSGALISRFKIQPIIVTLAVMFVGRAIAQMISGNNPVDLPKSPFESIGQGRPFGIPIQIIVIILTVGIMYFISRKTTFARRVEAVGDNPAAARLVGINIFTTTVAVYALCAALCSIAGIMEASLYGNVDPSKLGLQVELDAIAAVAIGGTALSGGRAHILGTTLGAIIIQLTAVIVGMNDFSHHYALIIKAAILILAVRAQRET